MPDDGALPLVLAGVRRFVAREVDAAAFERAGAIPDAIRARAAELGLFGLSIPEAHGGLGLDLGECAEVVVELARADRSLATMIGLHNGLGARPLIERGTPPLKARWLPSLASGARVASFAATEASAGSDLTRVRTTATLDGDQLVVDGEKLFVTNGGFAGLFTVLARTPDRGGARGQALVLVPRDLPGVSVGPEEDKLGLRASSTVSVRFDGVRVPAEHALGAPGEGATDALSALEWGRTLMAAGCLGTARAALDLALEHARTRRQFGRPLLALPGVRSAVAGLLREVFAMGAVVRAVGRAERAGAPLAHLAAVAKVLCSEGAFRICDRALQLHGGAGYLEDVGVARMLRDARVTRIFEGANEVLLLRAGTALYAAEPRAAAPACADPRIADAERGLAEAIERARATHGLAGIREPALLMTLARADFAIRAAIACVDARATDPIAADQAAEAQLDRARAELAAAPLAAARSARDAELVDRYLAEGQPPRPTPAQEAHP